MAKISVSATGLGVSPGKMMSYLGMLFVVIGALEGLSARSQQASWA